MDSPSLEEKRAWAEQFFEKTGASYDQVVDHSTFWIDRLWKKKIISKIPPSSQKILDLACGTGILTFAIAKKFPNAQIVGVDLTKGYLDIARKKAEANRVDHVTFVHRPAEEFLSDDRFDACVTSYLPKYADLNILIAHLSRMIAPGGVLVFHDFTYPTNRFLQWTFEAYFKLLPPIGGWRWPEWRETLYELPVVIRKTRWIEELTEAMRREGFEEIRVESLTMQGSALVTGRSQGIGNRA
ncbi:MAG: class I SAM-dependent methyltransferase [Nitrospirae bacterium]|nr:class I SAM-dependent methyltransferase [Candidatus Manganitrophaceae bacterium]